MADKHLKIKNKKTHKNMYIQCTEQQEKLTNANRNYFLIARDGL